MQVATVEQILFLPSNSELFPKSAAPLCQNRAILPSAPCQLTVVVKSMADSQE